MSELIRLLLSNKFYTDNKFYLSEDLFEDDTKSLYRLIINSQEKLKKDLTVAEIKALYKAEYPSITKTSWEAFCLILDNLPADISNEVAQEVLRKAFVTEAGRKLCNLGADIVNGKTGSFTEARTLIEKIEQGNLVDADDLEQVSDDLEAILAAIETTTRWQYNIAPLAKTASGIGPGVFGAVFARVECLAENSLVLMYNGTVRTVQSIQIGEQLMGPDSRPRTVTRIQTGTDTLYNIRYGFGEKYTVNSAHTLSLARSGSEGIHKTGDILNVSLDEYMKWPEGRKQRYKGWKANCITFSNEQEVFDPYLIGLWLGDGSLASSCITNVEPEISEYILNCCRVYNWKYRVEKNITYCLSAVTKHHKSFKAYLNELTLTSNKHIPLKYKTSSVENRRLLLAGLLDTDGYLNAKSNSFELIQKNLTLALDIVALARSLGHHCTIKSKMAQATNYPESNTEQGWGLYWRVSIYDKLWTIPTKVARKRAIKPSALPKRFGLHFAFSVEEVGPGKFYGLTVDGPDSLFLLSDYTVVHNCGKTAFAVSLCASPNGFAEQGAMVHFYCNEESAYRTKGRAVMAYTGMPYMELSLKIDEAKGLYSRINPNLKFFECKGKNIKDIEGHIRRYRPDVAIVDQLDKLEVFGSFAREDERLGELYVRFRDILTRYDCGGIGLSQASAEAEGKANLKTTDMALSRTSKAAECDVLIGIGKVPMEGNENIRVLNLLKNKITGNHEDITCCIVPEISRYVV